MLICSTIASSSSYCVGECWDRTLDYNDVRFTTAKAANHKATSHPYAIFILNMYKKGRCDKIF